jgi:ketosteroid isomerase-like protein
VTEEATIAELVATEDDWSRAILANDADRIAGYLHDDWVLVSDSGVMAATRFLAVVRSGELMHSAMHVTGETRVRIYGDTAVVTSRMISTAQYRGTVLDADEWTTDTFVRVDGRWLCVLTHLTAATAPPVSRS